MKSVVGILLLGLSPATGALAGCDTPGASVAITDARASRDADKNVVVDVDLLGHEGLGRNVGVYCVRVAFVEPTDVREECKADLEDGDTKTARFVGGNLNAGSVVKIRVRLGLLEARRDVVAP